MSIQNLINQMSARCQALDAWEIKKYQAAKSRVNGVKSDAAAWINTKLPQPILNLQGNCDAKGREIASLIIEPLNQWDERWLQRSVEGSLPIKVIVTLFRAPICAVRNVLVLFYSIIKTVLYACVHPVDAFFNFSLFLIDFVHALLQPENLSKMGAGMIGASLGQAIVTGNPVSVIGASLGATFVILGLCLGPLKAALMVEEGQRKEAARKNFLQQVEKLPEMFLTGFLIGLFLGGIQRAVQKPSTLSFPKEINAQNAQHYVEQFAQNNHLPSPSNISFTNYRIVACWSSPEALSQWAAQYPQFSGAEQITMGFSSSGTTPVSILFFDGFAGPPGSYWHTAIPGESLGFNAVPTPSVFAGMAGNGIGGIAVNGISSVTSHESETSQQETG